MDEIFLVNSSSFQDVEISASLRAGPSIVVDFTRASIVTGSFAGTAQGLTGVTASHIDPASNITASYADTASWALNAINGGTTLITASTYPITASWSNNSISASYSSVDQAYSSSISTQFTTKQDTLVTGNTYQITASWAITSSNAITASHSEYALSSSYLIPGLPLHLSNSYIQSAVSMSAPAWKEGRLFWDKVNHTYALYNDISDVTLQIGQELFIHAIAGEDIANGKAVYISQSNQDANNPENYMPVVYKASAGIVQSANNQKAIGLTTHTFTSGSAGWITSEGVIHDIDTSAWVEGDTLYLSAVTPGDYQNTIPGQPYPTVEVGTVVRKSTTGSILVSVLINPVPPNAYAGMTSYPSIIDNTGSSEVYVSTGSVNLYNNTDGIGLITNYPLTAVTFSVVSSSNASFIVATTNGVTASYQLIDNFNNVNGTTIVQVATVYRADLDAHVLESDREGLALANKLTIRLLETEKFAWESGYSLLDTGSNQFLITAGQVWFGATQLTSSTFDSRLSESVATPFNEVHWTYHSASQWVIPVQADGTYNNAYYDNGTNLTPLSSSNYCVNYFFRILGDNSTDEDTFIVIGNNQYADIASAQTDTVPPNIPGVLDDVALLVGRMIVQSSSLSASAVESAFVTNFGQSLISAHNSLGGLQGNGSEYYHLNFGEFTGTGTGVMVRSSGPTISDATLTNATITGSILGTVSTASYVAFVTTAQTASFVELAHSASYVAFVTTAQTASFVATASYVGAATFITTAQTASYIQAENVSGTVTSASYATTASVALNATVPTSVPSASWVSASAFITTAQTASYVAVANIAGTITAISASWASASISASYAPVEQTYSSSVSSQFGTKQDTLVTGSTYPITSSWAVNAINGGTLLTTGSTVPITSSWAQSSSVAISSSYSENSNTINVTASAANINYSFLLVNNSGSSKTMLVDGLNAFTYNPSTDTISGANLTGTSSWATNAITASVAGTASFLTQNRTYNVTASWAVTASSAISAAWAPGATSVIFSRGGTFYDPYGLSGLGALSESIIVWRAPFVCTATAIWGLQVANAADTTSSLTAWHNGATMLTVPISVTASNVWVPHSAGTLISTSFAIGDRLQITLLTCSFGTTQSAVQIDFTRP